MIDPQTEPIKIVKTVLSRLPLYYNFLLEKRKENCQYISSTVIAKSLKLNNVQVRKDLACVSKQSGKPRMGFEIESLITDIEDVLGFNNLDEAMWYENMLKKNVELMQVFQTNEVYTIAITISNLDLIGKHFTLEEYLEWANQ